MKLDPEQKGFIILGIVAFICVILALNKTCGDSTKTYKPVTTESTTESATGSEAEGESLRSI